LSDEEWGVYSEEEETETHPKSVSQVREKETTDSGKNVKLKDILKTKKEIPQRRYSPVTKKTKKQGVDKKPLYRIDSSNLNKGEIQRRFERKDDKKELEKRLMFIKSQIEVNYRKIRKMLNQIQKKELGIYMIMNQVRAQKI
jgi:hypothetical protein